MANVQEPVQLHYKDLIDIALGSTDMGLFNLHLLHTILQCLVVHLNLDATTIEYNGTQRSNIENFFANRASVAKQTIVEKVEAEASEEVPVPPMNLIVKDLDRVENPCGFPGAPDKIVLRTLPKCKDLLEALKCNTPPTENPLGKMVDLINLTERMTAAEIAIEKLSSLIYDLSKKNQALTDLLDEKNQQLDSLFDRLTIVEHETNINVGSVTDRFSEASGAEVDGETSGKSSDRRGTESASSKSGGTITRTSGGAVSESVSKRGKASSVVSSDRETGAGGGASISTSSRADTVSGRKDGRADGSGKDGRSAHSGKDGRSAHSGKDGRSAHSGKDGRAAHSGKDGRADDSGKSDGGSAGGGIAHEVAKGVKYEVADGGLGDRQGSEVTGEPGTEPYNTGEHTAGAGGTLSAGAADMDNLDRSATGVDYEGISSGGSGGAHLISDKPGEGMLKDKDSVVALFVRSQSQDLSKLLDEKKDDLFKDFQDMFICSGGLVTGKMLKHLERDLLRKLHLFKSIVFERLIAVECDLSGTQKEVKHINDNVEDLLDSYARLTKQVNHLNEFEKNTQEQLAIIQKNIHCLMGEREVRRRQIYDLIEAIEMVKTIKANKEELDTLALQKADKAYADSKVSIKKFNVIQNDLACSIIQTMEKNTAQDIDMANAVKRIELMIDDKIDKAEHNYKVAMLTKRIDEVSDKLNEMIKLRICPEGAGTIQMLKNVRCITCNDVVQMKMDESTTLSRTAIMKTKHQFALQVETECRAGTKPKLTEIIRSRYCGGEYTIVEPKEKVPQKTDFYVDANVCPPPMSDVFYIEGNDGALYRAEPPECAFKNTNSSHLIKRSPSQ